MNNKYSIYHKAILKKLKKKANETFKLADRQAYFNYRRQHGRYIQHD